MTFRSEAFYRGAYPFADVSSVVPGLTVWSLLALLWPGEGTPSLFPPSQSFGGPGAPPAIAGEVTQTFRSHSEETSAKAKSVVASPWPLSQRYLLRKLLEYSPIELSSGLG